MRAWESRHRSVEVQSGLPRHQHNFHEPGIQPAEGRVCEFKNLPGGVDSDDQGGGFSRFALYDLSTNPLQEDISKQRPEVTEHLKKKLKALSKDVMADALDWEPLGCQSSTA